jgi:hypothetical protein
VIAFAVILGCMALMLAVGSVRGNPGRAIADAALLVILVGLITFLDILVSRFADTRNAGAIVAMAFATGFALDAVYGLMAPERQRRRDKKLRRLMKRRA